VEDTQGTSLAQDIDEITTTKNIKDAE